MSPVTLATTIERHPDMVAVEMGQDLVMMSIQKSAYYGLSGVGPFIWEQMAEPVTVATLCQRILAEYDVAEATCQADVLRFIEVLIEQGSARTVG